MGIEFKGYISCSKPGCWRSQGVTVTVDVPENWQQVWGSTPQLFALCPEHAKEEAKQESQGEK